MMNSICVCCGSNSRAAGRYFRAARATGEAIAAHGLTLAYGGAKLIGLLNTAGYFDGLPAFCDCAVRDGFVRAARREMIPTGLDAGESRVPNRFGDFVGSTVKTAP